MQNSVQGWQPFSPGDAVSSGAAAGVSLAHDLGSRFGVKLPALDYWIDNLSHCPWPATVGSVLPATAATRPLYSAEERRRRDQTVWTRVQGVLAPLQFAVFLVSLSLVLTYLSSGRYYELATASVVAKTAILYAIMITGSIWENKVFGRYLFADAFFWEDVVSMLVMALHSAYLLALLAGWGTPADRMTLALAAYASYAVNATQFLLKLRAARLEATSGGRGR